MTENRNRALVVTEPGDRSVLAVQERTLPGPSSTQLQIAVIASGINFKEIYQREGVYPTPTPFVAGEEGSGRVTALGTDVTGFAIGDLVAWASGSGSHADSVLVDSDKAVPVPDGVDAETAAAAMLQGMTAHYLINSTYPVQPGDAVLVHAAAGGVGQLLVQLAKAKGAIVTATASTDDKLAKATALGADAVVRYADFPEPADLAAALRDANGGRGFSVVYDGVGRSTFEASVRSLGRRGVAVLYGASSGQVEPFDLQRLNPLGSLFVTRPTLGDYIASREEFLWRAKDVLNAVAEGGLSVEIGGRYDLTDAAQAYEDLESRRTTGKLILTR